jgi:uncharacterized protein DUF6326
MKSNKASTSALQDMKVHVKLKLASLWTSLMFCYIYGDYFGLFQLGNLQAMLKGQMGPLGPATQGVLLGVSALLAIPGLMIFLSLVMKPAINRAANIFLGLFYTVVMLVSMPGAWAFYIFLGAIEILLSLLIVWYAWRWPRQDAAG